MTSLAEGRTPAEVKHGLSIVRKTIVKILLDLGYKSMDGDHGHIMVSGDVMIRRQDEEVVVIMSRDLWEEQRTVVTAELDAELARLDSDRTAEPKTVLLAHVKEDRYGFAQARSADALLNRETGLVIPLLLRENEKR